MMKATCAQKGLTLLELLVVVFILSSIAMLTVSVVDSEDEQLRYEETRSRIEMVKRGIAGDSSVTVNGEPMIFGFAADMGRLPLHLEELLTPFKSNGDPLPEWRYHPEAGLWAGWRGPYVEPLLENGAYTFRDGWRNAGGLLENYGWKKYQVQDQSLYMQSFGSDGKDGGVHYAADYPEEPFDGIVLPADHLVDIRPLTMDAVVINNKPNTVNLRLRVLYPANGEWSEDALSWPSSSGERDAQCDLSMKLSFAAVPNMEQEKTFEFKSVIPKEIPWGLRSVVVVNDDSPDGSILEVMPPLQIRLIPRAMPPSLPKQRWTFGIQPEPGEKSPP